MRTLLEFQAQKWAIGKVSLRKESLKLQNKGKWSSAYLSLCGNIE